MIYLFRSMSFLNTMLNFKTFVEKKLTRFTEILNYQLYRFGKGIHRYADNGNHRFEKFNLTR